MFDEKTIQYLGFYVYMLIDPKNQLPFYIGKGLGNRVFNHKSMALTDTDDSNAKYDKIREIIEKGEQVKHVIIRHGLTETESFHIEAAIIDAFEYCNILLSNIAGGYNSIEKGLMTSDEIIRHYNAEPLTELDENCIIININRKYQRGKGLHQIYEATKETWTINKKKLPKLKYVLSEYKGLIVAVFEVNRWYEKERGFTSKSKRYGETKIGYGFESKDAPVEIRNKYLNKSIAHIKKRGAASAIRYKL
jgi:uncharacterized protein